MSVWLAQTPVDRIEKLSFLVDALFTANGPRNERALSNVNIRGGLLPDAVAIQQAVIQAIEPVLCGDNAQICKQWKPLRCIVTVPPSGVNMND